MSGLAPVRLAEHRAAVQHGRRTAAAAVREDLGRARQALRAGRQGTTAAERYLGAQDAALRVAAVVLAARARPSRTTRPRNAWRLVAEVAPELGAWATFFAATEATRDAVRAGTTGLVSLREADDLLRDTGTFLSLVEHAVAPPGPAVRQGAP